MFDTVTYPLKGFMFSVGGEVYLSECGSVCETVLESVAEWVDSVPVTHSPMEYLALKPLCVMLLSVRKRRYMVEPVECSVEGLVLPHSFARELASEVAPSRSST